MKINKIEDFIRGWFVGDFEPTLYKTGDVEIAYKKYKKGDKEQRHYHKIATEITLITKGKVKLNNKIFESGDIVTVPPMLEVDFMALEDSENVVVKIPGATNDKYLAGSEA